MSTEHTQIHRWRSQDVDDQAEMLQGWEQEYRQLSCGKFVGQVSSAHGPRITIVGESTNQSLHESVVAPVGQLVFGLVLNRDDVLQVNRRQVDTTSLLVLEGGREYDFRTIGCTDLLGIVLDRDLFFGQSSLGDTDLMTEAIRRNVVNLDASAAMMLRHFWLMLSQILQRGEESWPATMPLNLLADSALNNIWLALNMSRDNRTEHRPSAFERQSRVVRDAIAFMRARLATDFDIADVCAATHVSARTLQYHFETCLQIAPLQYLKTLRLNAARRMLRQATQEGGAKARTPSIADIAASCGYDHPSRFAGDYKRQFGELPSEAIHQRQGAPSIRA
jgi:AraC family ethanolamine operon transcriptional activator